MDHRYWLGVISDVGEALANILQSFLADLAIRFRIASGNERIPANPVPS
jgi:hypothetical protein